MSIDGSLDNLMRRLRVRVRLLLVERYGLFGGCVGAAVCSVVVLLSSRYPALIDYCLWAGIVIAGVIIGCAYGLLRRLDDLTVALAADRRTGLKERLSTAVSFPDADELPDIDRAVISDAGERFSSLRSADIFRHRFGRPHTAFCVAALVLTGILIWPMIPAVHSKERLQEIKVMKDEGTKIVKIARDVRKNMPLDKEMKRLASRMEKLGRQMQSARMPKKQAMLSAKRLTKDVKEAQDRIAKDNNASKSMEQAQAEAQKSTSELAKSMAAQIAKEKGISLEEAMKELPSDKRMSALASKAGPLTSEEMRELEKLVSKYSNPNSSLPIPPELAAALAKLMQNEDYRKAMEIMRQLALKLESGKGSAMDRKLMKAQLEALAKALKNTDLDKLAKRMLENAQRLAAMSPEELQKLLDEIKKAQKTAKACSGMCLGLGSCGMGLCGGMGIGGGSGGVGYGKGGDNSNSGPTGKLHDVKELSKVGAQLGASGMIIPAGETKGAPDTVAPTAVPYTKVYTSYSKAAEKALSKEQIPPAYRTRVKDYFSSLE